MQAIQVLVLQLGSELIQHLPSLMPSGQGALEGGRMWLATLVLGVAVLQLARKVPRLMPGYPGGSGPTSVSQIAVLRHVSSFLKLPVSGSR